MNEDGECRHGLAEGTCASCRGPSIRRAQPEARAGSAREPWAPYEDRFNRRPETFAAYVDVWKRSSAAQQFPGGWTAFSRAASAEPAIDPLLVRRAEEVMEQFGYASCPKTAGVGRRWRRVAS